ncbi:MAG: hypothetical protein IPM29_07445 [Planctomycetes bacterium]|nr:hypothetical protein [Planctomycetota bacterium]
MTRTMFQFKLARGESVQDALHRLEAVGVRVDRRYGAIAVDPEAAVYVARGDADDEQIAAASREGFQAFGDVRIRPASPRDEPDS